MTCRRRRTGSDMSPAHGQVVDGLARGRRCARAVLRGLWSPRTRRGPGWPGPSAGAVGTGGFGGSGPASRTPKRLRRKAGYELPECPVPGDRRDAVEARLRFRGGDGRPRRPVPVPPRSAGARFGADVQPAGAPPAGPGGAGRHLRQAGPDPLHPPGPPPARVRGRAGPTAGRRRPGAGPGGRRHGRRRAGELRRLRRLRPRAAGERVDRAGARGHGARHRGGGQDPSPEAGGGHRRPGDHREPGRAGVAVLGGGAGRRSTRRGRRT